MSILNSIVNNSIFQLDEVLIKAIFVPLSAICVGLCLQMVGSSKSQVEKMHNWEPKYKGLIILTKIDNFTQVRWPGLMITVLVSYARDKINGLLFSNVRNASSFCHFIGQKKTGAYN